MEELCLYGSWKMFQVIKDKDSELLLGMRIYSWIWRLQTQMKC